MMQKKLKLLYVLDILKKTDEQHPITTNQIVSELENYGIEAERKSVLRDINLLNSAIEGVYQTFGGQETGQKAERGTGRVSGKQVHGGAGRPVGGHSGRRRSARQLH
jgi:hypothetical protein